MLSWCFLVIAVIDQSICFFILSHATWQALEPGLVCSGWSFVPGVVFTKMLFCIVMVFLKCGVRSVEALLRTQFQRLCQKESSARQKCSLFWAIDIYKRTATNGHLTLFVICMRINRKKLYLATLFVYILLLWGKRVNLHLKFYTVVNKIQPCQHRPFFMFAWPSIFYF